MNTMPKDPVMLLSVINTKLRDFYPSLDELCEDLDISRKTVEEALNQIDYHYSTEQNQFI